MSELAKTAWTKVYAWALPTALVLGAYCLFVHPRTRLAPWLEGTTDAEKATIFVLICGAIAICLNTFSSALYRILEGYLLWPEWLQKRRTAYHREQKAKLSELSEQKGWQRGLALEKLAMYPKDEAQIVPTRFGNALRAFETYGKSRFNLDSQSLWYELHAVVPQPLTDAIAEARSSVDFLVAMVYLNSALCLFTVVIGLLDGFQFAIAVVGVVALLFAILCHWLAVRATSEWAYAVQALVNIGRVKLAESMGLQLPDTLESERTMWGLVTRYGFFARAADGTQLDQYRKKANDCTSKNLGHASDGRHK